MTALGQVELDGMTDFLTAHNQSVSGLLRAELIAGGRSNLTYRLSDSSSSWILRRPPTAGLTPSAHDVAREVAVTSALEGSSVPVAAFVGSEQSSTLLGAPFTVVEFVDGRTVRSSEELEAWSDEEVARCQSALVSTLADLHAVDFEQVGLGDLARREGYADRQIKRWSGQWIRVQQGRINDADLLLGALRESIPTQVRCSVVHGDFRIDNTILDSDDAGTVRAVVDWELSTLGDPVADVALMCVYGHPGLDDILGLPAASTSRRFAAPDRVAELYETASGTTLENWDFHLGLAYYKLAVIAAGIEHRRSLGAGSGQGFDTAGLAVRPLLAAGRQAMGR